MTAWTLPMRPVRNVLKLKYEHKLTRRQVARSDAIGTETASDFVARARAAGLRWSLPDDLDDAALEQQLYAGTNPTPDLQLPDLAWIHRELSRSRPG